MFRWLMSMVCLHAMATATTAGFPRFETQVIDSDLKIGYAVIAVDIDGDHLIDLVVADQHQLVWYHNPGQRQTAWSKHLILDGQTRPDNVCVAAIDILGDGLPELVLGAGWRPSDTLQQGQLVWLKRGPDIAEPWTMYPLPCDEPSVHRVRAIHIDGDGRPEVVQVPLMGRGATRDNNWMDGRPLAVVALKVPELDPENIQNWRTQILSQELNVAHNFCQAPAGGYARPGNAILVASYQGVSLLYPEGPGDQWTTRLLHPGNQDNPTGSRGASEIKHSDDRRGIIATIEPWHGNQVVVYTPGKPSPDQPFSFQRQVIDQQLRWGHGVWMADLNNDGLSELIIGVRDDPNPAGGDDFAERRGVRLYRALDQAGQKWEREILDNGGVAVEDLTAADLDGNGYVDIIAVGRQTGNVCIYWNLGMENP